MSSFGLMLFVLWIAISNLAVGFALAVAMGHGPRRRPLRKWPALLAAGAFGLPKIPWPQLRMKQPAPEPEMATRDDAAQAEEAPHENVDELLPLEVVLAEFQTEMTSVRGDLQQIDERVRDCSRSPSPERLEACVSDLKDVGNHFLDQQADALQAMEETPRKNETDARVVEEIRQAADAQASQIRQTLAGMADWEADPAELDRDCQRLMEKTGAMVSSCQALDNCVAEARTQLRSGAGEPNAADSKQRDGDAAHRLEQKDAIETLSQWWADDPEHERPLTMALVDVDRVAALNDDIGRQATDQLLRQVERQILALDFPGSWASRIDAQRFLLLLPDSSPEQCTEAMESLRRLIEEAGADATSGDPPLTASCAVAICRPGDTAHALASRAEATLAEAKQFGRNRTFLNEGEFPTPVVAANEPAVATHSE